jgi:predicted nucleic acid-binding Zn ribbon protein
MSRIKLKQLLMCGRRICAWCKKDMGNAPGIEGDTHTICPACYDKMKKKLKAS